MQVLDYRGALIELCLEGLGSVHAYLRACWLADRFFSCHVFVIKGKHTNRYANSVASFFTTLLVFPTSIYLGTTSGAGGSGGISSYVIFIVEIWSGGQS